MSWAKAAIISSDTVAPTTEPIARHRLLLSELARVASDTDSTVQPAHSGSWSSNSIAR